MQFCCDLISNPHMQPNLPMNKRKLDTRFGILSVSDEELLLFKGHPVLAGGPALSVKPQKPMQTQDTTPTKFARLRAWCMDL